MKIIIGFKNRKTQQQDFFFFFNGGLLKINVFPLPEKISQQKFSFLDLFFFIFVLFSIALFDKAKITMFILYSAH